MPKHVTLISQYAFYPMHWEAFRRICTDYDATGSVISPASSDLPPLHQQLGWVTPEQARQDSFHPDVRLIPAGGRTAKRRWFQRQLAELRPDAIWVQEEPTNWLLQEALRFYRNDPHPQIICAIAENIFKVRWWRKWHMQRNWRRLNRLIAVAQPSIEGIRRAGMPSEVAADTLVAGAQAPPESLTEMPLPIRTRSDDWIVGYAGRICEEKGWRVLLRAILNLPPHIKLAIAGGGPDADELQRCLAMEGLEGRAAYVGVLPKAELWRFYKAVDCIAAPHLTFPHWKEQFGGVLADAMVMGLPIVGSDSGAIPEVVGPAGLIVPENDSQSLADAIRSLSEDRELARQLGEKGRQRFSQEFAIPVYAAKIARALGVTRRSSMHAAA